MKWLKRGLLVALAATLIGSGWWWNSHRGGDPVVLRTVPVQRGDLQATISATGTVEPEEVVDVGAQVAGQIIRFGADLAGRQVDYGSYVDENTVLAQIDDSLYQADVNLARAQLAQAKSGVVKAEADLKQLQAKLDQADRDWQRAQKLQSTGDGAALAQSQVDAYKAAFEVAQANVGVGQAALAQAQATVAQYEAALKRFERNLSYTTIKSPVKGVIIDRRVNIGQTVVASLNAPSLFLIAKDLSKVQVWIAVNEADIYSIYPGQPVTFTLDAFPGQTFRGVVGKIRPNAQMTQNVVTYTVVVNTDNPDLSGAYLAAHGRPAASDLDRKGIRLPYLTANAQFITGERHDVLLVPNAALRWVPRPELIAPEFREQAEAIVNHADRGRGRASSQPDSGQAPIATGSPSTGPPRAGERGVVWIEVGQGLVKPVRVMTGLTDGVQTEVSGKELAEGAKVVIGEATSGGGSQGSQAPSTGGSPFTPRINRRPANAPSDGAGRQ